MSGGHADTTKLVAILKNASVAFGGISVLEDIDLSLERGEFVAVVGPSGAGKTTLLNLLAGYVRPSAGMVTVQGRTRTLFQQGGLFPWRTVHENVLLGLRHLSSQAERERRVTELLTLIGVEGFGDHYPHQLSGGMRQRVELARALAGGDTDILLLDEPFSALDYLTRLRLRREVARILADYAQTGVVLVTHDIEEAAQLADRVLVLTARPARVRCELRVELPRPREATHPTVVEAVRRLLGELGVEGGAE